MRRLLMALALAAVPALAAAQMPYPPESRWPTLPRLAMKPDFKANLAWIKRAQALEKKGECSFKDERPGWSRLVVPFAVQLSAAGAVQQVKVGSIACPPLERFVAGLIRQLGPKQVVKPRGTPPYWRSSRFIAGWQNDAPAPDAPTPDAPTPDAQ